MEQGTLRVRIALLATLALTLLAEVGWAQIMQPVPQGGAFVQFGLGDDGSEEVSGVFLPTERTAKRRLDQARELIDTARFGEAVRMLDTILEEHEDSFFQPEGRDSNYRSLKVEARRLLGELPAAGQESYELQFGVRAQKLLADAVEQGDLTQVAEVARRFFHTQAGYEATLLLGQSHLDHQRPLAAALAFQQLVDVPSAAARFEPNLSVLAAMSWARAGMSDKAQQTLVALRARQPQAVVKLAGREVPLFGRDQEALAWLENAVGKPRGPLTAARADQWVMYRGAGGRNAESVGGRPLLSHRWRVRTANDPTIEKLIQQMRQAYLRQEVAALPSLHPLAVEDVVLMRTAQHLLAVDFQTGKRIWEVKPEQNDTFDRLIKTSRGEQPQNNQLPQLAFSLEQRMWDDAAYGTLSSDGERVFVLQDLDLLTSGLTSRNVFGGATAGSGPKTSNRLSAFELATEGKLVWEVGGPDGEAAELREAFFLGPPLPLSGHLYALAEIKGGIRLVVLDAATGELQWMQQLADLERNIAQDPFRRLAGAMPSFTDGVLICPTSAGAIVAVDLSTRSLLWAHKYPVRSSRQRNQMAMMMMRGYPAAQGRSNDHWVDASATIVNGRVLLTPVESETLFCLDLLTGQELWQLPRGDNLYVACVNQGEVVLVGDKEVTAVKLADGKPAWPKAMSLPAGGLPSGRGYYSGGFYYLPLTSAEVVKIDLDRGAIVDRAKSREGHVPGNLICYRGEVLSQGVDFLETYYQVEALQEQVTRALAKNPDDAVALARQGELQFDAGELQASINSLQRSFELDDNDLTRELYIRSLLEGLRVDFAAYRAALPELEKLVDRSEQRSELVRLMASGLQQAGETLTAFERYMQLVDLADDEDQLEQLDKNVSVRRSRWIQAQLASLHRAATPDERAEMDAAIARRGDALSEAATAVEMRKFLDHFASHETADSVRLRLAQRLLASEPTLECELLLNRLAKSVRPESQAAAAALRARLLQKAGRVEDAAAAYADLVERFGAVVCLDGRTGQQLFDKLAPEDPIRTELASTDRWAKGKVTASTSSPKSRARTHRRLFPLELRDELGPSYENMTVSFDQQAQAVVGHDGLGNVQFQVPLNQPNTPHRSYVVNPSLNYGKVNGHLLVVSMGYQILALDTLNTTNSGWQNVLWKQDLTEQVPGMPSHQRVQMKRINLPGGEARYQAEDDQGRPIGTLGPILAEGITFQRFRSLLSVDPLTGKTLWIRHDVPAGSDLFGDDQMLLAVPPGATEAMVIRPLDGSLIGTCQVPALSQRLASLGPHVLKLETTLQGQTLTRLDPWKKKVLWQHAMTTGSKMFRLGGEELGILQRDGRFVLLSLADGSLRIDQQLEPEPQLQDIYLQKSRDQYLLITNHPATKSPAGVSISAAPGGVNNPIINGRVYAFDRQTGQPRWHVPAVIEQHGLLLPQPSELPVLVFVRHIVNPNESGRHRTRTSVLCLDKRTGRAVYSKDDFSFGTGFFSLNGERTTQTVTLTLPTVAVNINFTDEPVPPEPPLQAGIEQPPVKRGSLHAIGSLFKALGKAASDLNGPQAEDDLFDDEEGNPFGEPADEIEIEIEDQ